MQTETIDDLIARIESGEVDVNDPTIQKALKVIEYESKFNSTFLTHSKQRYEWQKRVEAYASRNAVTGILSANQSGKTETGCFYVTAHATGVYPEDWQGKKYDRPTRIAIAAEDWSHIRENIMLKLFGIDTYKDKVNLGSGMIPRDLINLDTLTYDKEGTIRLVRVKHVSGGESVIRMRAYSQGRKAAQGFQMDVGLIDEHPDDEFWSEFLARLTAVDGAHIICAFTPLKEGGKLIDTFQRLEPSTTDTEADEYGPKYKEQASMCSIRASAEDCPHITPEMVKLAKMNYPAYSMPARLYGVPILGHGRIIPFAEEDMVYVPNEVTIVKQWRHLLGLDLGHGNEAESSDPTALVLTAWCEADDVIYVPSEWQGHVHTTKELSRVINSISPGCPVAWPKDLKNTHLGSQRISEQLQQLGVPLLKEHFRNPPAIRRKSISPYAIADGIDEINQRISEETLRISTECRYLLYEIERYQFDENKITKELKFPRKAKDHSIDALRYSLMSQIQMLGRPIDGDLYEDFRNHTNRKLPPSYRSMSKRKVTYR